MGFGPTKFLLLVSLALLKTRAPGAPRSGLRTLLIPVAIRVKYLHLPHITFSADHGYKDPSGEGLWSLQVHTVPAHHGRRQGGSSHDAGQQGMD